MKGKKQTVKVALDHKGTDLTEFEVPALVFDNLLAIHRPLGWAYEPEPRLRETQWTVTHLPTGAALAVNVDTQPEARRFVVELLRLCKEATYPLRSVTRAQARDYTDPAMKHLHTLVVEARKLARSPSTS